MSPPCRILRRDRPSCETQAGVGPDPRGLRAGAGGGASAERTTTSHDSDIAVAPTVVLPGQPDVRTLHRDLHPLRSGPHLVEPDAAGQPVDGLPEVGDRADPGLGEVDA